MNTEEENKILGNKREADQPLIDILPQQSKETESLVLKKCIKCLKEEDIITIKSIEQARNFLKDNQLLKEDNKKIDHLVSMCKLSQEIDLCKICLIDNANGPSGIDLMKYFKMLQIVKCEKPIQPETQAQIQVQSQSQTQSQGKDTKSNNVIQMTWKFKGNNKPYSEVKSNQGSINETNSKDSPIQGEKEFKTVQPIFTTILPIQHQPVQQQSLSVNSMPMNYLHNESNHYKSIPTNLQTHYQQQQQVQQPLQQHQQAQQQSQPNLFKNSESNVFSNSASQSTVSPFPDYHGSSFTQYDKKKPTTDAEIQEKNLELINQALDELKAQIGTMKYCNQLQKNSLASLFNYMEMFNEQFKSHQYYPTMSNNQYAIPQHPSQHHLLYNNNNNNNMMDYFPNQMPMNMPINLNQDNISSLFHGKVPNNSPFQSNNPRKHSN